MMAMAKDVNHGGKTSLCPQTPAGTVRKLDVENPEQQACPLDRRGEATSHEAMTQKVNGGHTKSAFSRVDNQPMPAETLKQRPEVGQLLPHRGACHQVVIQVD